MGMRLVIEVYNKGERIAQGYYHWSGYSISSTEIVNDFIDCYTNDLKDKKFYDDERVDMTYKAVKALEASGAKPCIYERLLFKYMFPDRQNEFRFDNDRDEGIISIQENVSYDMQVSLDINLSEEIVSEVIVNSEEGLGSFCWDNYDSNDLLEKVRFLDFRLIDKDKLKHEHETLDYWKKHNFIEDDCYQEMKKKIDSKRYVLIEDKIKVTNYDVPFNSFYDIPFDKYKQVFDFLSKLSNIRNAFYVSFSINGNEECLYQLI